GTQMKIEKPGKGAVASPCDSIEGPIVKLKDGSVVRVENEKQALEINERVVEVLFAGDILIGYGEFLENNHKLLPAGYCEEWWRLEAEAAGCTPTEAVPTPEEALQLCEKGAPMHPRYTYFYHDISKDELRDLTEWLCSGRFVEGALQITVGAEKRLLEIIGVPHRVVKECVVIEEHAPLLAVLGLSDLVMDRFIDTYNRCKSSMEIVNSNGFIVRENAPTYIGARMGRPEKAKPRKMSPPVNLLFPLGQAGGRTRDLSKAVAKSPITVEIVKRQCTKCKEVTSQLLCPKCGSLTHFHGGYETRPVDIKGLYQRAAAKVGTTKNMVKGVVGMTSAYKIPEPIEKGILRAKHGVFVFKDGT
ncbi:MAG: DNA polymerase II large subunit, partial [Candidatus Hydrothermarchaeales archaeon]